MSDERELVALDVAIGMLRVREGNQVHTFRQVGPALLGACWERDRLIDAMRQAPAIEVTGPSAQSMGHGLAIEHDGLLFIETTLAPERVLSVWTLFDSPADAPGLYVLRRFESGPYGTHATSDVRSSKDIEELRHVVRALGLYCIGRVAGDEPQIVESWL